MAEGGFDPSERKFQQLCRYFVHGACYHGDSCRFLHDRTGTSKTNNVCKFYQLGNCSYGDRCRYDHVRTGNNTSKRSDPSLADSKPQDSKKNGPRIFHNSQNHKSSMVTLKKGGVEEKPTGKKKCDYDNKKMEKWAKAKDFVPGQKFHAGASYACAANKNLEDDNTAVDTALTKQETREEDLLCPYFAHGNCPYKESCTYIHGDVCDICQFPRLHPSDEKQREEHTKECLKMMEIDMEHSFAVKESKDKECCICLELVLEKAEKTDYGASKSDSKFDGKFGILENCTHCFCLNCIRRWRSDKSFGKNVRVCPICRVHSDFVTPSDIWVEDEEKKKKFIQDYKDALSVRPCQYFKQGKGECPFNEKCFYKHAYPDGTIAVPKPRKPRRRVDADGESSRIENISLWDFLEQREDGLISLEDELSMYLLGMLNDSDSDDDIYSSLWYGGLTSSDSDSDFDF